MKRRTILFALVAGATALAVGCSVAMAASGPFGVGLPEPAASGGGVLPGLFRTIAVWQSSFYRDLTATLKAMKTDGSAGLWLVGLSFLYGVLHALGPGHGKAVVSAYVLANRETARNGALLAMVSALAQAVSAVALVSVAAIVVGATSIAMTRAAEAFETASFALIAGLGGWLVWRKIVSPLAAAISVRYAPVIVGMASASAPVELTFGSAAACRHDRLAGLAGEADCGCGHVHLPPSESVAGRLDWRKASSAILAVGFRPCTGALIVLVFSLSQGLYAAGILSTFAMAIGTGLTVATLTLLTVSARALSLRLAGRGESNRRLGAVIEGAAALAVLAFGLLMLGASLFG